MQFKTLALFTLLSGIVLGQTMDWSFKKTIAGRGNEGHVAACPSANGAIHFFWANRTDAFGKLNHRVIYPNNSFIERPSADIELSGMLRVNLVAQVSQDDQYMVIVYSDRVKEVSDRIEELFIYESFNGGDTWQGPVRVNKRDEFDRVSPSVLLEQDTGRVIISYVRRDLNYDRTIAMVVKEPGSKSFGPEILIQRSAEVLVGSIGYTVDKETSKRYIHLLWKGVNGALFHTRSDDKGFTWANDHYIGYVRDRATHPVFAINTEAVEGAIYVQYDMPGYKAGIDVAWSRDHGATFESNLPKERNEISKHAINMCGSKGRRILISVNDDVNPARSFIRFLNPYKRNFRRLIYPFGDTARSLPGSPTIVCSHLGYDKYAVVYLRFDPVMDATYMRYGILSEN